MIRSLVRLMRAKRINCLVETTADGKMLSTVVYSKDTDTRHVIVTIYMLLNMAAQALNKGGHHDLANYLNNTASELHRRFQPGSFKPTIVH